MPTTVRPSTAASYASLTRQHLIPSLGRHRLDKLTAVHVRALLKAKSLELSPRTKRPLSARTLQYLHAVLRLELEQARRDDLVVRNVAGLVAGPRVQRAEIKPLTAQEARQLLAASAADRLAALWLLVIALGLRRGEALALRWDDIDLERGHLQVRATLHRVGGKLVRDPMPKTKSSRRALPLPALVVDALKAHRSSQAVERTAARAWATRPSCSQHASGPRSSRGTACGRSTRCVTELASGAYGSTTSDTRLRPSCSCRASTCASSWAHWGTRACRRQAICRPTCSSRFSRQQPLGWTICCAKFPRPEHLDHYRGCIWGCKNPVSQDRAPAGQPLNCAFLCALGRIRTCNLLIRSHPVSVSPGVGPVCCVRPPTSSARPALLDAGLCFLVG